MSSAVAHTDERCRQPAFLPGPPPPQEVESSSGSAKVSAAPLRAALRCPRCPSAGRGRRAPPCRAVPCHAGQTRAMPRRAMLSCAMLSRAMPSPAARRRPRCPPSPRVSLEGPREPASPRAGGAAAALGCAGCPRGEPRVPAAGTARRLPVAAAPAPCGGDAGSGTACSPFARPSGGGEPAPRGAVPRGEPRRGVRGWPAAARVCGGQAGPAAAPRLCGVRRGCAAPGCPRRSLHSCGGSGSGETLVAARGRDRQFSGFGDQGDY